MNNDPGGRPAYSDEQYEEWLKAMKPFLQNASSPYYAICQAGLLQHKDVIYRKYALKDWFRERIDILRNEPGEIVNNAIVTLVRAIEEKARRKEVLTHDDIDILKFYAEKSRSAQPFFVSRQETTVVPPIDDVIKKLENNDNIDDVGDNIKKELAGTNEQSTTTSTTEEQVVATNPPVQNQEQAGSSSDIPPQSNPETPPPGNAWT